MVAEVIAVLAGMDEVSVSDGDIEFSRVTEGGD